ncbi:acyl-CoA N-acyltransferase [Talaromyces proteolyticus]|uniref:Acyl-CoA N-acyltransferase n=1 Tax=Talaromyces proteolyticus TaxID=1131652 RepID=A0AAD4PRQ3_9EURO|nr:acyl-CoA N-acyltransferase [Talaromyces proteolyticus]KAH8689429.1 acyl-CoA N-acyltransferase [Talaromyces proteolyticus]
MATTNLQFRIATADDASKVQQIVQSAFQTNDSRPDWTGNVELASKFRIPVEEVQAKIANPDITTFVALDADKDNALVGCIDVSKRGTDYARISMLAVDDSYQRGGVGRQVLAYAEDYCRRTWGTEKFSLNALSTRKALIEWYNRRGYRKTGTSPFPFREALEGISGLPDDLCFIEMEKA